MKESTKFEIMTVGGARWVAEFEDEATLTRHVYEGLVIEALPWNVTNDPGWKVIGSQVVAFRPLG